MYSVYKLNKQGDNIQLWCTAFPIWNQSIVPCPVLTVTLCVCVWMEVKCIWTKAPTSKFVSAEGRDLCWLQYRHWYSIASIGYFAPSRRSPLAHLQKTVHHGRTSQMTSECVARSFTSPALLPQSQLALLSARLHCLENGSSITASQGQLASPSLPCPWLLLPAVGGAQPQDPLFSTKTLGAVPSQHKHYLKVPFSKHRDSSR